MMKPICFILGLMTMLAAAGCQSPQTRESLKEGAAVSETLLLREGDTVKIAFPGAPNLDSIQQIRRDGKITLPSIGEVQAAGLKPPELEKQILALYGTQLLSKEVSITVQSATFPVFVTGQVLHPGKVVVDRPMTALEAIMEAGGFNYDWADLKAVMVIRKEEDGIKHYALNMKKVMHGKSNQPFGKSNQPFYLKPSDIVYVPEKKLF